MKKLYTLLLLLPVQAMAQPTLSNVEDYTIGFSARYVECNPAAVGNAGANQTWDFSTLTPLNANDTTSISVTAVPAQPMFPGANMVLHQPGRSVYLNKTAAETQIVGLYDTLQDARITYTDPVKSMTRPVTFGMNYTDNCAELDTIATYTANGTGNIVVSADGWGTLKLPPNTTFTNVIRVKSIQTQVDTVDFLGTPMEVTITFTTHAWYDANQPSALLQMVNIDISSTLFSDQQENVYFLAKPSGANVAAVNRNIDNVTAYLSDRQLVLNGQLDVQKDYHVVLYDIAGGKQVMSRPFRTNGNVNTIDVDAALAAGTYVVVLRDAAGATSIVKVVKE